MPTDRRQLQAYALLGVVMVLWAGNAIVGRAVRFDVGPFTLAFIRWAGATLVIAPFAIRPVLRDWPEIVRGWKIILLLGVLGVGVFNALLYTGLHYSTAANALLIQSAVPAAVVILDRLLFGVRSSLGQSLGVAASMFGVVLIVFEADPAAALRLRLGPGDLLLLTAVAVWAVYTVCLRLRPAISPISFIAVTFFIGVLCVAPLAAWEWSSGMRIVWSGRVVGAFLFVALLPSLLAYFIYNWAAQVVGPARAGQAQTLMPLFGAFLSALLLGELLHPYHFAGMAFIVSGIAISVLAGRRKQAAGAAPEPPLEQRP